MKELIEKLNSDYSQLEFINHRIDAIEEMIASMTKIGEKLISVEKDLITRREEKKHILDTMLSTSSKITKYLYDGAK
jgi:prefoldin subunit 5